MALTCNKPVLILTDHDEIHKSPPGESITIQIDKSSSFCCDLNYIVRPDQNPHFIELYLTYSTRTDLKKLLELEGESPEAMIHDQDVNGENSEIPSFCLLPKAKYKLLFVTPLNNQYRIPVPGINEVCKKSNVRIQLLIDW